MADIEYLTASLTEEEQKRIFSKIEIDPDTGCWNWTAQTIGYGYGCVEFRGRHELTHRVLYAWKYGPIPRGCGKNIPQLDHFICNNTRCCNPDHLKLVSAFENIRRSNANSAINARKTHCKNGHPLPEIPNSSGQRVCKICRAAYDKTRDRTESVRIWQALNPEKTRAYKKTYRERQKAKHESSMLSALEDQA